MDGSMASLAILSDKLNGDEQYADIRNCIRTVVSKALTEGRTLKNPSEQECVTHSLIANWLESNGYKMASRMMKMEMSSNYVQEPERYLKDRTRSLEQFMKGIEVSGRVERKRVEMDSGRPFGKKEVDKREFRKEPIKITPFDEEQWRQNMQRRDAWIRNQQPKQSKREMEEDSDDSSDFSSSDSSSSSSSDSPGEPSQDEKAVVSNKNEEAKKEKSDKEVEKLSWGPSKLALVTDLPPISSSLPSISSKPSLVSEKEESAIDKLFEDDAYDLEEFEEEDVKLEVAEKDLNQDAKKEETDPPLSEGESIDELEDFDTGLLSSGGSDYSF